MCLRTYTQTGSDSGLLRRMLRKGKMSPEKRKILRLSAVPERKTHKAQDELPLLRQQRHYDIHKQDQDKQNNGTNKSDLLQTCFLCASTVFVVE